MSIKRMIFACMCIAKISASFGNLCCFCCPPRSPEENPSPGEGPGKAELGAEAGKAASLFHETIEEELKLKAELAEAEKKSGISSAKLLEKISELHVEQQIAESEKAKEEVKKAKEEKDKKDEKEKHVKQILELVIKGLKTRETLVKYGKISSDGEFIEFNAKASIPDISDDDIYVRYIKDSSGKVVVQYLAENIGPTYGLGKDWIDIQVLGYSISGPKDNPDFIRPKDWFEITSKTPRRELLFSPEAIGVILNGQDEGQLSQKADRIVLDAQRLNDFLSSVGNDKLSKAKENAKAVMGTISFDDLKPECEITFTKKDAKEVQSRMIDLHKWLLIAINIDYSVLDEGQKKTVLKFKKLLAYQLNYLKLPNPEGVLKVVEEDKQKAKEAEKAIKEKADAEAAEAKKKADAEAAAKQEADAEATAKKKAQEFASMGLNPEIGTLRRYGELKNLGNGKYAVQKLAQGKEEPDVRSIKKPNGDEEVAEIYSDLGPAYGVDKQWIAGKILGCYIKGGNAKFIQDSEGSVLNTPERGLLLDQKALTQLITGRSEDTKVKKARKIAEDAESINIFLSTVSSDKLRDAKSKTESDLGILSVDNSKLAENIKEHYVSISQSVHNPDSLQTIGLDKIVLDMFYNLHILSYIVVNVNQDGLNETQKEIASYSTEFLTTQLNYLKLLNEEVAAKQKADNAAKAIQAKARKWLPKILTKKTKPAEKLTPEQGRQNALDSIRFAQITLDKIRDGSEQITDDITNIEKSLESANEFATKTGYEDVILETNRASDKIIDEMKSLLMTKAQDLLDSSTQEADRVNNTSSLEEIESAKKLVTDQLQLANEFATKTGNQEFINQIASTLDQVAARLGNLLEEKQEQIEALKKEVKDLCRSAAQSATKINEQLKLAEIDAQMPLITSDMESANELAIKTGDENFIQAISSLLKQIQTRVDTIRTQVAAKEESQSLPKQQIALLSIVTQKVVDEEAAKEAEKQKIEQLVNIDLASGDAVIAHGKLKTLKNQEYDIQDALEKAGNLRELNVRFVDKSDGTRVIQTLSPYGSNYGLAQNALSWVDGSILGLYAKDKTDKFTRNLRAVQSITPEKELLFNNGTLARLVNDQHDDILAQKADKILKDARRIDGFLSKVGDVKLKEAKEATESDLKGLTDQSFDHSALLKNIEENNALIKASTTTNKQSILADMFKNLHILSWIAQSVNKNELDETSTRQFSRLLLAIQLNYLKLLEAQAKEEAAKQELLREEQERASEAKRAKEEEEAKEAEIIQAKKAASLIVKALNKTHEDEQEALRQQAEAIDAAASAEVGQKKEVEEDPKAATRNKSDSKASAEYQPQLQEQLNKGKGKGKQSSKKPQPKWVQVSKSP